MVSSPTASPAPSIADASAAKEQKPKRIPRCELCGRPFDTWREAWEHEDRAHAMEQGLFAKSHG